MVKKDIVKLGMGLLVFGIGLRSSMKADEAEAAICTKCGPPTPCHPY
jgi:predicted Kef-type K+ transport protein